jgi:hypothetical protein
MMTSTWAPDLVRGLLALAASGAVLAVARWRFDDRSVGGAGDSGLD